MIDPKRPSSDLKLDSTATANSLRFLLQAKSISQPAAADSPVVHLKQRLVQADGADWLKACLKLPPFEPLHDPESALQSPSISLAELAALKERAKEGFAPSFSRELRLAAIAAYFFAIAAALKYHRVRITSQPLPELRDTLIDLAADLPQPWSSLLSSAAFVEPTD